MIRRATILYLASCALLAGCGKATVIQGATSADNLLKVEIVAVKKAPLRTFDAELRIYRANKLTERKLLFGGRDALQDVRDEIQHLEVMSDHVIVTTRGNFTAPKLKFSLGRQ